MKNFEEKLQEYVTWLIGNGDSISTAERRAKRIKTLKKSININKLDMKQIYSYIKSRMRKGIKKKTLRIEMKDLEYWFKFININTKFPMFKKEPAPEPFIPLDDLIKNIVKNNPTKKFG